MTNVGLSCARPPRGSLLVVQSRHATILAMVASIATITDGIIRTAKFFGDVFASRELADLARRRTGVHYRRDDLAEALGRCEGGTFVSGV